MTEKLYAIVFTETKKVLGTKIYLKLHHAKSGFSHIRNDMKPQLSIVEFTVGDIVVDGSELDEAQKERRLELQTKRLERNAQWRLERAQKEFEEAKKRLESLQ